MQEHYIVTVDRGRLRIYAECPSPDQTPRRLEVVEAMDFPDGVGGAEAAREAEARRGLAVLAAEVNAFLSDRPAASWDFAVAPTLYDAIMEELSPETRRRLKRALSKDLVRQNAEEVRVQFATVAR